MLRVVGAICVLLAAGFAGCSEPEPFATIAFDDALVQADALMATEHPRATLMGARGSGAIAEDGQSLAWEFYYAVAELDESVMVGAGGASIHDSITPRSTLRMDEPIERTRILDPQAAVEAARLASPILASQHAHSFLSLRQEITPTWVWGLDHPSVTPAAILIDANGCAAPSDAFGSNTTNAGLFGDELVGPTSSIRKTFEQPCGEPPMVFELTAVGDAVDVRIETPSETLWYNQTADLNQEIRPRAGTVTLTIESDLPSYVSYGVRYNHP